MSADHLTNQLANPGSPAAWTDHEHLSDSAQIQAQKLVDAAGSPELAKRAVDAAAAQREEPTTKDDFAKQLGFVSYLDMVETSTPVASADEKHWAITPLKHGKWLAWNEQTLPAYHEFDSRAKAVQYVKHQDGTEDPGTSP